MITYENGKGEFVEISSIHIRESKLGTLITCELNKHVVDPETAEVKKKVVASGKGLNAADAFTSALKDLIYTTGEYHPPKISDR